MRDVGGQIAADDPRLAAAVAAVGRGLISRRVLLEPPASFTQMQLSTDFPQAPADVLDLCLRGDGFTSIMPDPIQVISTTSETGELGGTYVFRWWFKRLVPVRWAAFIDSVEPGREFSDLQLRGVFRYFHHTHTCDPVDGGTRYTDTVRFIGPLGARADRSLLLPQLRATFEKRHRRMARLLGDASA